MCVISAVFDHYEPKFPVPDTTGANPFPQLATKADIDRLEKLLREFHEAVAAAKVVDKLTGQEDCVDPEKAKLLARVERLEAEIAALKKPKQPRPRTAKTRGRK